MDDYEVFEAECEKIRKENDRILAGFHDYLAAKNLTAKTINKHMGNIEFYINDFLLYEEPQRPGEGIRQIDYFLGSWFIRKAMWASAAAIKENISSLKHFYTFMQETGQISLDDLVEMKEEIKEGKKEWLEAVKKYDDPGTSLDDIW